MTNDPLFNQLREVAWRRRLTPEEEARLNAFLAAHPEAQADWEVEQALGDALDRLPEAPAVSSNFTSRVLQAVELETAAGARAAVKQPRSPARWVFRWLPRAAIAGLILGTSVFSLHELREAHRSELARSVAAVSDVTSLPNPEILKDFDTIRALNQTPAPDEQLLTLLQ